MTIFHRQPRRCLAVAAAVVTAASLLGACGSSSSKTSSGGGGSSSNASKPTIVLGDKNFTEEYILGDLYQMALEHAGYKVTLKSSIGTSEITDKALTSGVIDMYPEYTGVIYTELAKLGQTAQTAQATYQAAKKWENGRGFTVLNPTPFQDADGVATTKAYADQHGLKTIGDLSKVGSFTYTGPPENATRFQGVLGLKQAYGLSQLQFIPLTIGSQYTALDQGKTNTVAIFTTDGELASGKYAVLTDTKGIFGYQNVVPVIANKTVKAEGPDMVNTLNKLDALLTFPAIQQMNEAAQINKQNPQTVAEQFLKANGMG